MRRSLEYFIKQQQEKLKLGKMSEDERQQEINEKALEIRQMRKLFEKVSSSSSDGVAGAAGGKRQLISPFDLFRSIGSDLKYLWYRTDPLKDPDTNLLIAPIGEDATPTFAYAIYDQSLSPLWGNPEVFTYISDFSGAVAFEDGWSNNGGISDVSDSISIGGETDCLRVTSDASFAQHVFQRHNTLVPNVSYRITFSIYVPSTNNIIDGFGIQNGQTRVSAYGFSKDTWIDIVFYWTYRNDNTFFMSMVNNVGGFVFDSANDDELYFKDMMFQKFESNMFWKQLSGTKFPHTDYTKNVINTDGLADYYYDNTFDGSDITDFTWYFRISDLGGTGTTEAFYKYEVDASNQFSFSLDNSDIIRVDETVSGVTASYDSESITSVRGFIDKILVIELSNGVYRFELEDIDYGTSGTSAKGYNIGIPSHTITTHTLGSIGESAYANFDWYALSMVTKPLSVDEDFSLKNYLLTDGGSN